MAKTKVIRRRVVPDIDMLRLSWEQVGKYMYYFGQLELALGDLIHHSLRLSKTSARMLLPHVMYAAKLDMIKAIIPVLKQPESWKSEAKKIIGDCKKFIDERNMFCHGAFSREPMGVTRFDYIGRKGNPPAVARWPDDLFETQCKELERLEREVSALYPGFRPTTHMVRVAEGHIGFSTHPPKVVIAEWGGATVAAARSPQPRARQKTRSPKPRPRTFLK